jgi:rhodanese-related sulfurtransferase
VPQPTMGHIEVEELAKLIASDGNRLQLIDVREPDEVALARVEGFHVLPLSEYDAWSDQIKTRFDPNTETIVMCHHGVRSAQMCQWLINQGFTNVKNVVGGIDAYSILVDPSVRRY